MPILGSFSQEAAIASAQGKLVGLKTDVSLASLSNLTRILLQAVGWIAWVATISRSQNRQVHSAGVQQDERTNRGGSCPGEGRSLPWVCSEQL